MHARELMELAALVSAQSSELVGCDGLILASALEQYWSASKCRLDRWARALKRFSAAEQDSASGLRWRRVAPVVEEILMSEVLTRVWSAAAAACDNRRGLFEAGPIAGSIFVGHLEARHRAMSLIYHSKQFGAEASTALNRLRRRTERWSDLLVGRVQGVADVGRFAVDAERAASFREDAEHERQKGLDACAWSILLASLRTAFQGPLSRLSPNADLNCRIAVGIAVCFPRPLDALGTFAWYAPLRIANTTSDVQRMIDQLVALDA